jgi:hemerythrin-like domain-containing protein
MSMNKLIHSAVRRDLARMRTALDSFNDGDRARANDLRRGWNFFEAELTRHHEGEHRIAWPAMEAVGIDSATLEQFDVEHDALAAALSAAGAAMVALAATAARADADAAAVAMAELEHVADTHLRHEEAVTEPLYAKEHDNPVIKQMGKDFSRDQSLRVGAEFFAWVTYGATSEEVAALKHSVPGPVLALLPKIFGRRYYKEIAPIWG